MTGRSGKGTKKGPKLRGGLQEATFTAEQNAAFKKLQAALDHSVESNVTKGHFMHRLAQVNNLLHNPSGTEPVKLEPNETAAFEVLQAAFKQVVRTFIKEPDMSGLNEDELAEYNATKPFKEQEAAIGILKHFAARNGLAALNSILWNRARIHMSNPCETRGGRSRPFQDWDR